MLDLLMMELEGHRISARIVSRALCPLLLALLPLLTGCGSKERTPPPYELNPSPKEAVEVVVTTHDAPEDIYAAGAWVTYRIANDCLPPIDNFEGVRYGTDKHTLDITLQRVGPTTFKGTFFRDGLAEKDYFGRGPCRWAVALAGANLETKATRSFTYFSISATTEEASAIRYSSRTVRPQSEDGEVYPADGMPPSRFIKDVPMAERGNYFSYEITLTPRKE
ncbi:hypothetical protein [Stenotrophomonas sp.]|uniref:hypothetical protein n=1 Tax=Stenotrophomonas sp. TaxID=69392 RepID=UPI0028ABC630|nr:hypothetical protein [Stenotrophomonas sp.]